MKTVGEVRQKLKQVKFRYLKKELEASLVRTSSNCVHNRLLEVPSLGEVSICALKEGAIACDASRGIDLAPSCESYACRYQKEEVKSGMEEVFTSSIPHIAARYPDAAALMWVLDEPTHEEIPLPDQKVFVGTFFTVPVYTDAPQGQDLLVKALNELLDEPVKLTSLLTKVQEELQKAQSDLSTSEAELLSLRDRVTLLESESSARSDRIEDLNTVIDRLELENDKLRSSWLPGKLL
jgi:hypothetical protein